MTRLETFDPYTSYRLHWFPYEIVHCPNLRGSRVSTRALYGNYKYRPPFPRLKLKGKALAERKDLLCLTLEKPGQPLERPCSVCRRMFVDKRRHRVWISLRVATDTLPLLVNACSEECVQRLPKPAEGYVQKPHLGGVELEQPRPGY